MTKSDDEPHKGGPPLECYSCLNCDPDDEYNGRYVPCMGGTCYTEEDYSAPPRKGYPRGVISI